MTHQRSPNSAATRTTRRWSSARLMITAMAVVVASLGAMSATSSRAAADFVTTGGSNARLSWDAAEPSLTAASVSSGLFGQTFSTAVAGQVYAQPLVVGQTVVVATEHDMVYGINAVTGAMQWATSVGLAEPNTNFPDGFDDITPEVGVTATPVVDPSTGTVYVMAHTWDGSNHSSGTWLLHALSASSGAEQAGFPVTIAGVAANDPSSAFNPVTQNSRPGLLLLNGWVYSAFASFGDAPPYKGWIIGVNAGSGRQWLWTTEAGSASEGGIWMSGAGLMADGSNVFFATGNGNVPPPGPATTATSTLGNAVVRMTQNPDGSLSLADYFAPSNAATLNTNDLDVGSGGPGALPDSMGVPGHPHLTLLGGKEGRLYLLDRDNLGGEGTGPNGTDAAVAEFGPGHVGVFSHGAVWPGDGGYVYLTYDGVLDAFRIITNSTTGAVTLKAVGTAGTGYRAISPMVTSNGTNNGSALVWGIVQPNDGSPNAELRAFNAVPQAGQLTMVFHAPLGTATKFSVPSSNGGRVYVGTFDGHLVGFGMRQWSVPTIPVGGTGSVLRATAATGASDVWAVGSYFQSGQSGQPHNFTEHWNGSAWAVVPTHNAGVVSELNGVTALAPNDAWAVGDYTDAGGTQHPLNMHWDGSAWTTVVSPLGGVRSVLNGVAAVATNDVWTVGTYWDSGGVSHPYTQHWDGTRWNYVPSLTGGTSSVLNAVTAQATNNVWAVGTFYDSSGTARPLSEHWDGSQWNVVVPQVGGSSSVLNAVSAVAANDMWSVGTWYDAAGNARPLTEHWDGAQWTIVVPLVGGSTSQFTSVSAVNGKDVWAVGVWFDAAGNKRNLTEHWDGTTWTLVQCPFGGVGSALAGVVAVSASNVWDVGTWYDSKGNARPYSADFLPGP